MITACDIRYCSADAEFVVKEVDIGLAADVGTLQRLPKVVGNDRYVCMFVLKSISSTWFVCFLVVT